jgi:PAS domain S-box-containing protein
MAEPVHGRLARETRDVLLSELAAFGSAAQEFPRHVRELFARLALDEMYELVGVLAPDGTLLEVNAAALVAGGLERESVVGRPLWEARWWTLGRDTRPWLMAAVGRAAGGEFVRQEVDILGGAGGTEILTVDFSLRPVKDAAGAVIFIVAEGRDVTAMRSAREAVQRELAEHAEDVERLAEELGRRKRELETALDAMRFAREQADRASAQKTSLFRMVAHELRTPLAALLLQVDRLRRDAAELPPQHRDAVARMRSAMSRLASLIDSLLEYARIDAGSMTIAPVRLDPAAVAIQVVDDLRPLAQGKELTLSAPAAGSVPPIETDARLFRLVLLNLVQNAVKFTDSGSVSVSIGAEAGEHRISVADTGRGIALEDQARIFEPFEQLETIARKHTPGIGLGLTLVREMVGALGGRISLDSRPGAGSTFTVSLPSWRGASGRDAAPTPAPH